MITPEDTVIVGVSGGADSVCLLHLMLSLKESTGSPAHILVAHVQHGLRGEEGEADEAFVRDLCLSLGVECRIKTADVSALSSQWGVGIEEAGRHVRYAFFDELAQEFAPAKIATAHNRKDNAETVLLHLTRGCGMTGAAGISPVFGNRIRPLLTTAREEIEEYCREHGLNFRTDSTNADVHYSRNRIRHEVLPSLNSINPQAEEAICRFAELARQDEEYFQKQVEDLSASAKQPDGGYQLSALSPIPSALQGRVITKIIQESTGITPERSHVEAVLNMPDDGGGVTLLKGYHAVSYHGALYIPPLSSETVPDTPIEWDRDHVVCGKRYRVLQLSPEEFEKAQNVYKLLLKNTFDCAMIVDSLYWHSRQPGETFQPIGRPTKPLKKWMNEETILPWQRSNWPMLRDASGIVWVEGMGCAERVKVTKSTQQIGCVIFVGDV